MIRRHNKCIGFRFWKWGSFQIELWFAPHNEFIEPHVHEHIDSAIILLAGSMLGTIGSRTGIVSFPKNWLRKFSIPAGVSHSALVGSFVVFANLERWKDGATVTSASKDFTAV